MEIEATPAPYADELQWPPNLEPIKNVDEHGTMPEPFAQYEWLRDNSPVVRIRADDHDIWLISRYEDVRQAARKPKVFGSQVSDEPPRFTFLPTFDAPEHTRLRQVYARAFNPKSIQLVADTVRDRATTLIDRFVESGGGDIIKELNVPLTMATISGILGVPADDVSKMKFWSDEVFNLLAQSRSLKTSDTAEKNAGEFFEYLEGLMEELYAQNSDSVGGHLARAWKEGQLSAKEAREMCAFLFVAGHDTTTMLLGNGIRQLAISPELLGRLRNQPEDTPKFIEELARYRGTVHRIFRRTKEDVVVSGYFIPKGAIVRLLVASANRDEARFSNPNEFDIDRDNEGHVGFGLGVHSCIGAPLARLQARIFFEILATKVEAITLDGDDAIELMPGHSITLGAKKILVNVAPTPLTDRIFA